MRYTLAPTPLRVLLVEDNEDDALLLLRHLLKAGYVLHSRQVYTLAKLEAALQEEGGWDVVISDYSLPGFSAAQALEMVLCYQMDLPFIVVSGMIDEETACNLMRAGAQDYLLKDRLDRLVPVIERERREALIRCERREALGAVQVSEARFQAMAANVPGVLFQMRVEAGDALRFLFVSEASQMLLGMPADALLGHSDLLLDLMQTQDREEFLQAFRSAAQRGVTLNWEGRIFLAEDDFKWINVRCSPRALANGRVVWEGVMWNITHSKQAEMQLRASRAQLAELSDHLQRVKEEERERIARDIHDVLGGTLVGIKISASLLGAKLDGEPALRGRVRDIEHMLDEAITTAGRVARELRPGILKEFGLAAAVESYAEDYAQRTGIRCEVLCADHDIETDEGTALALFRTYQEALTNVSKHAAASRVEVRLMQEGDDIVLEVGDDGRGVRIEDMSKPKSFGLRSIRERLRQLGGEMEIRTGVPQGTLVLLRAPLAQREARMERTGLDQ
ncbi:hybrid sensor histidine kinase/response regulator [Uliginosibacterium gangwonense]|uniref:hybrid sensor histidine kinase/response regulator n=1 Tax=Uliginosibacterium gangwonense TaxID=392736 RepID=UPI00037D9EFA|nr:histidine kinase [Uliginosibacterium gangwonense]